MKRLIPMLTLLLAGCAGTTLTPPPQPTYTTVAAEITQQAAITADPVTTWQVADGGVRAACFAYLNSAAAQQTNLGLAGIGVGAVGAGLSLVNPLAGLGASLGQTLLAGLSSSGYVPTTADAILVENYLNTYEAGTAALPPTSNAMAVSWAVDEWYHCSAGGIAELGMQAKTSAQLGLQQSAPAAITPLSLFATPVAAPRRPVIVVNPQPSPVAPLVSAPMYSLGDQPPPTLSPRPRYKPLRQSLSTGPMLTSPSLNSSYYDEARRFEWEAIQKTGRAAYERAAARRGAALTGG